MTAVKKSESLHPSLLPLPHRECASCSNETTKKCGRCFTIYYCGASCQRKDWDHHRQVCRTVDQRIEDLRLKNPELFEAQENRVQGWKKDCEMLEKKDGRSILPDSTERILMGHLGRQLSVDSYYDALDTVPGIRIIQRKEKFKGMCTDFAFHKADWFKMGMSNALLGFYGSSLLESFGFQKTKNPKAGDIVLYSQSSGAVMHFGVVSKIDKNGTIFIQSKFGERGHVYEHRLELVGWVYGDRYEFMTKNSTETNSLSHPSDC